MRKCPALKNGCCKNNGMLMVNGLTDPDICNGHTCDGETYTDCGIESGVIDMSGAGWPATGERWAVADSVEQGGVKGWFRSLAIPRRWAGKT